jgi:hypothetical protein
MPDAPSGDVVAVVLLAEDLEPPQRLGLQPAVGELLDAVGDAVLEVAAVEGRRLGLEERAPLGFQLRIAMVFSAAMRAASSG